MQSIGQSELELLLLSWKGSGGSGFAECRSGIWKAIDFRLAKSQGSGQSVNNQGPVATWSLKDYLVRSEA